MQEEFIYDDSRSYESNLESWYRMCNDERSVYRKHGFDEPVLEWEEAVSMFRKMYGFKDVQKRLAGIF